MYTSITVIFDKEDEEKIDIKKETLNDKNTVIHVGHRITLILDQTRFNELKELINNYE